MSLGTDELDTLGQTSIHDWSRMWGLGVPDDIHPDDIYGPHIVSQELNEADLDIKLQAALSFVRELVRAAFNHRATRDVQVDCDPDELELRRLNERFYFKNRTPVCEYLKQHRFLVPVLFEIRNRVCHIFGLNTLTDLELFTDPEDNPSDPILFVLILTNLPASEATTRLAQLDEEWWLDRPSDIKRLLSIDVEYVSGSV